MKLAGRASTAIAAILGSTIIAYAGSASAETYRFLTWKAEGAGDAQAETIKWLVDEFAERTGGEHEIEVMWGGSAASIREISDALSAGLGAMGDIPLPYYMDKFLLNNAASYFLPQPLSTIELAEAQERWHDLYPQFGEELAKYNLKAIAWRPLEEYGMLCREPMRTLEDFKGKRIRSYGTAYPALIEAMGATPVSVTTTEAYEALERGILDCTPTGLSYAHGFKYDEVAKYFTAMPLGSSYGQVVAMNLDTYNSMDEKTKQVIDDLGQQYALHYAIELNKLVDEIRQGWEEKGVEYIEFSADDMQPLIDSPGVQGIRQEWIDRAKEMGVPAEQIAKELKF